MHNQACCHMTVANADHSSCWSCNEEELCPHGYRYNEICHPIHDELDGIDEQSTLCNSDGDEQVVDNS